MQDKSGSTCISKPVTCPNTSVTTANNARVWYGQIAPKSEYKFLKFL